MHVVRFWLPVWLVVASIVLLGIAVVRSEPALDPVAKARSQRAPPGPAQVDHGQLPKNELGVVQPSDAPPSNTPPSKFEFILTPQDKAMWAQVLTAYEACIGSMRVISRNETCSNLFVFLEQFNKRVQDAQVANVERQP